jgi:hypothetical protein
MRARLPFEPKAIERRIRACRFAIAALALASSASPAEPFSARDENPLLAGFGIPLSMPAEVPANGTWDWSADIHWASSAIVQDGAYERLIADAETRELRLAIAYGLAERWAARLELPYRYTGGGDLDAFIDGWHDLFGMSEGMRPLLPRDDYRVAYARDGSVLMNTRSSSQGLADVAMALGYQWSANENGNLASWLRLELPTGDADELTGNGGVDVSLTLAAERRFAQRWSAFTQGSVTYLGDSDVFAAAQEQIVWSGLVGIGVDISRSLELKAQIDGHTAAFDTDLDYLGEAIIFTIGGSWTFKSGWRLDIGVSEDIVVDASPDVAFVIGVRRDGG